MRRMWKLTNMQSGQSSTTAIPSLTTLAMSTVMRNGASTGFSRECEHRGEEEGRDHNLPQSRIAGFASILLAEVSIFFRFLATGDSYKTIAFSCRFGHATVARIVANTCEVIWKTMKQEYVPQPTEVDWVRIADGFERQWNFPNCVGALFGKHVVIPAPPGSGSLYFNYKGSFSMVLMTLVDHQYCFTVVDIGAYGRNSDGGIYTNSTLG